MKTITIQQETIINYINDDNFNPNDLKLCEQISSLNQKEISIEIEALSEDLLEFILTNDYTIDNRDKAMIALSRLRNIPIKNKALQSNIWDHKIRTLDDVLNIYEHLKNKKYNIDLLIFDRKFPSKMTMTLHNATKYHPKYINLSIELKIYKIKHTLIYNFSTHDIMYLKNMNKNLSFKEIMSEFNIEEQTENISEFERKVILSKKLQRLDGKQMTCKGFGYQTDFKKINMCAFNHDSKGIIESDLEMVEENKRSSDFCKHQIELPFVRVFSLLYKKYIYMHIDDICEYEYDKTAFEKLFLPTKLKNILFNVFSYSSKHLTGDIINNKHGGLIVLAEGKPGTGKTSTAEIYSEFMQKPFYSIQVDEIGTNPVEIELNLTKIFARIEKWDAVILFDEVDVFLSKRDDNIEKSAIVGIFLRMMDYFRGMMFLTTNRADIIDEAILSRVTLGIKYPDFDDNIRSLIWKSKLSDAGIKIDSMNLLVKENLNGRQIRNMVRLAKIVLGNEIKELELISLMHDSLCGGEIKQ